MSAFFEQQPVTIKEIRAAEKAEAARRRAKRRHRIGFPTPNFYLFAFTLNLAAMLICSWMLRGNLADISLLVFAALTAFGMGMSVYSTALKPVSSNFQQRRRLVATTVAYGFVVLSVQLGYGLLNPNYFA